MTVIIQPSQVITDTVIEQGSIADFGAAGALTSADLMAVSQSGDDKKTTISALQTFLAPLQVFRTVDVDALVTGQTAIVPAVTGKRFVVVGNPIIELTDVSGSGTVATVTIGQTASYDNVATATPLTGLDTVNVLFSITTISGLTSLDVNTNPIQLNVSVAALVYDTYTISATITGFYY